MNSAQPPGTYNFIQMASCAVTIAEVKLRMPEPPEKDDQIDPPGINNVGKNGKMPKTWNIDFINFAARYWNFEM